MRHARFDVAHLEVQGVDVALKAAYLLVVEREEATAVEWECVAFGLHDAPIGTGTYRVGIDTLDGRRFEGDAILVRSVEGAHVLRGDGPLDGLDPADLDPAPEP